MLHHPAALLIALGVLVRASEPGGLARRTGTACLACIGSAAGLAMGWFAA